MYLPTYLEIIIKIIFLQADNQHRVRYYFKNTPLRRANLGTITLVTHQFSAGKSAWHHYPVSKISDCNWNCNFINASTRWQCEHNELNAGTSGHLSIMAH